jgi:hypothetical protein
MTMRNNWFAPTAGTCAALMIGLLLLPAGAGAEQLVFDLEPSASRLTISANIFGGLPGFFLSPQAPGADVTSYSGTVTVDVDDPLAPTSIKFVAASAVAANNGDWLPNNILCETADGPCDDTTNNEGIPDVDGDANPGVAAPASYGLILDLNATTGLAYDAQRDIDWAITSAPIAVTAGEFPSEQTFGVAGQQDLNVSSIVFGDDASQDVFDPFDPEDPDATDNDPALLGSYAIDGGIATLTLPIDITFLDADGDFVAFAGQFLATTQVGDVLLGDVNLDSVVNGLDVDPFVDVLLNGPFQVEADMNEDGVVNGLDVDPFVEAVVGGGVAAVPEPSTLALAGLGLIACGLGCYRGHRVTPLSICGPRFVAVRSANERSRGLSLREI